MTNFKGLKTGARLVLTSTLLMLVVFGITVYLTITKSSADEAAAARSIGSSTAAYYASTVESMLSVPLDEARALASVFQAAAANPAVQLTRDRANTILGSFLEQNPNFLDDYVCFEPNAFDGQDARFVNAPGHDATGRFIPVWSADAQGKIALEALTDYDKKGPGDYYLVPRERNRESVIDPYIYKLGGKDVLLASLVVPVHGAQGAFIGIAGIDVSLDSIQSKIAGAKIGNFQNAYAHLYSANGTVVASIQPSDLGKRVDDVTKDAALINAVHKGEPFAMELSSTVYGGRMVLSVGYPISIGNTGQRWLVNVNILMDEMLAGSRQVSLLMLLIAAGAMIVIVAIMMVIARSISRPLAQGVAMANRIAAGDLTATMDVGRRRDEFGQLSESLNGMVERLRAMVSAVHTSAEQVSASSEEISASAQKLAEGAQSQASTLEQTSASVEELTSSVEQVAEHAQSQAAAAQQGTTSWVQVRHSIEAGSKNLSEIATLATQSVEKSVEGAKAVQQVVAGINRIAEGSEKIGGIVNVISDIADQTNLLALNASIEAARAGEHGRGFAVVADEVSKLADRSASSTKEIEVLIKESVRNVSEGVKTAAGSQAAMEEIRASAQKTREMIAGFREAIEQQVRAVEELSRALESVSELSRRTSAATEEQATNAKQVSTAVESVNEVTQSAASAAEQMSSATEQLASMAQELQNLMAQFKIMEGASSDVHEPARDLAGRSDGNGNGKGTGTPHFSLVKAT